MASTLRLAWSLINSIWNLRATVKTSYKKEKAWRRIITLLNLNGGRKTTTAKIPRGPQWQHCAAWQQKRRKNRPNDNITDQLYSLFFSRSPAAWLTAI
jgi:hypothetical protein